MSTPSKLHLVEIIKLIETYCINLPPLAGLQRLAKLSLHDPRVFATDRQILSAHDVVLCEYYSETGNVLAINQNDLDALLY